MRARFPPARWRAGARRSTTCASCARKVPGFEAAYALEIAPQLGIRETRRLVGEVALTADDVIGCADFDDTIGVNGWPLELHVAGDVEWRWPAVGSRGFNQLPYRMLLPRRELPGSVDNLLVAGRCASMTHEGHSAARVSGGCFVMGQAAGTAAALALARRRSPACAAGGRAAAGAGRRRRVPRPRPARGHWLSPRTPGGRRVL